MSANTPQDVDRQFGERLNAGDLDGLLALYEPEASFVPREGETLIGRAAISKELASFLGMKPKITMNVVRVVPCAADVALLYNDWRLTAPAGADGVATEMSGKAIEIVRRQKDGTWLFLCDAPFMRG